MIKRMVNLIFILLAGTNHLAAQVDSILTVLDQTLTLRPVYSERKETQIAALRTDYHYTQNARQKFDLAMELFDAYTNYQTDSAIHYARQRIEIARDLLPEDRVRARMNLAEALMITGMYKEVFEILAEEEPFMQGEELKRYKYHLYHSLYMLMGEYALSPEERAGYRELQYHYKDSILQVLSPEEMGYQLVKSTWLLGRGDYNEALRMARAAYERFAGSDHDTAMTAYVLSDVYHHRQEEEPEIYYLAVSAIGDLRAAVKEYISLRKLAVIMYRRGDIDRAYDYMKCSMEDAIFSNARLRTLEISRMLPFINETYDLKMKQEKNKLLRYATIISVLSLILIGALLYIYLQLKALVRARRELRNFNQDLVRMNDSLHELNTSLAESNIVKEEYIGYVFNMCSAYIDKLEEFRKRVNRHLKTGQVKELMAFSNSSSLVGDELKEFYRNFDLVFLNLYPDFIEEFNSLLEEDEYIRPKEGDLLTPELRIYALVRLGISDSVKIAGFLHYSPQTVYNYRMKVRNKAKVSKDKFPEAVRQIGRLRK